MPGLTRWRRSRWLPSRQCHFDFGGCKNQGAENPTQGHTSSLQSQDLDVSFFASLPGLKSSSPVFCMYLFKLSNVSGIPQASVITWPVLVDKAGPQTIFQPKLKRIHAKRSASWSI